jgi:hypothetical protein
LWRKEIDGQLRNELKWGWITVTDDAFKEEDRVEWIVQTSTITAYREVLATALSPANEMESK